LVDYREASIYVPFFAFTILCAWNDLKNNTIGRKQITDSDSLKTEAIRFFRYLQKTPERMKGYFNTATIRYAVGIQLPIMSVLL